MDRSYQKQQEGRDTQLFLKCSVKVNTTCLLYTSDAADEQRSVDLGGRRIIKKNFLKQKTAYEINRSLVGSEMCIRDRLWSGNMDRSYQKQQEGRDTQLFLKCSVKVNTTTSLNFQGLFKYRASFSLIFKDLKRGFPNSRTFRHSQQLCCLWAPSKIKYTEKSYNVKIVVFF